MGFAKQKDMETNQSTEFKLVEDIWIALMMASRHPV
jgi:hypothetical protein